MKLINLLDEYHPKTTEELGYKEKMISFIKQYPDCFERTLSVGHITASAWLLSKNKDKALLMHHTKLNKWFQLGGHCDGDYNILRVAIKEAQEESGIKNIAPVSKKIFDLDIHLIPENSREKAHNHYDVRFLLQVVSNEKLIQNHEAKELRWINKNGDKLPTNNPSVVRMFNKWVTSDW